jgi:hypothetical protein
MIRPLSLSRPSRAATPTAVSRTGDGLPPHGIASAQPRRVPCSDAVRAHMTSGLGQEVDGIKAMCTSRAARLTRLTVVMRDVVASRPSHRIRRDRSRRRRYSRRAVTYCPTEHKHARPALVALLLPERLSGQPV